MEKTPKYIFWDLDLEICNDLLKKIRLYYAVKDFDKNPTGKEPRNLKPEAEVISQKIALRSDSIQKIMNYKLIFACKLLTVHEKSKINQWNSIFLHYEYFLKTSEGLDKKKKLLSQMG